MKKLIFLLLIFSYTVFAGDSAEKIIKKIQSTYDEIENLTAEFTQIESFKLTGAKNEIKGKIYIKNGEKYKLETEDQIFVTDGKTVWSFNVFNNQVLIDRMKPDNGALIPRDVLFKYPKDHIATLLGETKKNGRSYYIVRLDPKDDVHGFIKNMKLWVDADSYHISTVEYTDLNENISQFGITKIDTETLLDPKMFEFKIEPNMDVVDLRM